MSSKSAPVQGGFRFSQLIYDTRYRSNTIQTVALIALMALIWWLVNNTLTNLEASGKGLGFSFLTETSGYDINQHLLEYDARDSHLRASLIGVLNTLLLAFMGCVTATIVGVFVGVLRLSKNWLIARIMTVYIEMFRNIPVLLWILIVFGVMIEIMPTPRDFRGDNPAASMMLFDSVAITNRGIYIPEPLFSRPIGDVSFFPKSSMRFDVSLELVAFLIALGAGIFASGRLKRRADRIQNETGDRPTTWWQRTVCVVVLPVLVLIACGFHLGYPELKGFNFQGGTYMRNSLIALWLALSLYTAAFIAEIVRAGIMAISKGQTEASLALGISPGRTMSLVVLPQALRVIIPPLISHYLNLTKNSSLAIAVGYMDITGTLMGITLNVTGREIETVLLVMLIYLSISLSISAVMNVYNNRVKLVER
ncbi:MAG: ABC transporter permease subunit [Rhodobacteraceae bacterium]|nr:ABC transporter permease subunit [Paracoccaceae bacterium]